MTHDFYLGGHYMDEPYYQFLSRLLAEGMFENTLILFFSDHGIRYGPLRETHSGELETRLPFIFIRLPENTDQSYVENLMQNQYRLTTHFDIHATMVHFLNNKPDHTLPHGLSLIDSVLSEERDCTSAAIPEIYCSCYEDIPVLDYEVIHPNETIPKIVGTINSYSKVSRKKCVEYEFVKIKSLYNRVNSGSGVSQGSSVFLIQIYVNPGMALFDAILKGFDNNKMFRIADNVIRISKYGNQSHCISHKIIKNYCFCRDLLSKH